MRKSKILNNYSILNFHERHQLLVEWNNTKKDYPENKVLHQLFEEQAEKTPNQIAIVYKNEELTYAQLNQKANQLARYLREIGIGPDMLVAIAVEKSFEMIIGVLGILKAGGAYVPLDPDYPIERLQFLLKDAKISVLLIQSHLQNKLKKDLSVYTGQIIIIDKFQEILLRKNSNNLTQIVHPYHLAYVIYSSGSTGLPKGVLIEHEKIVQRLFFLKDLYQLKYDDSFIHYSSISIDASLEEYLLPLISGAKCYFFSYTKDHDPRSLLEFIYANKITTFNSTPSFLQNLEKFYSGVVNNNHIIKRILTGGESLSQSLAKRLVSKAETIWNLYGPTETTIDATAFSFSTMTEAENVCIGRPVANMKIYILDTYLNPVPIGEIGEIYIGGTGLARGYLNRPDLTAQRFIPNPFIESNDLNQRKCLRLHKTEDLGRYLPDGNIEFLGRIEDLVMINDSRVELQDIELALTQHNDINYAIVIPKEDKVVGKYLIAFLIPHDNVITPLSKSFIIQEEDNFPTLVEELNNHLSRSFPNYMIPSRFIFIDKIPLTPNGKVNKKALLYLYHTLQHPE